MSSKRSELREAEEVVVSVYISFKEVPKVVEEEFLLKVKEKLSSAFSEYEEFKPVFRFVVY